MKNGLRGRRWPPTLFLSYLTNKTTVVATKRHPTPKPYSLISMNNEK
jgi:hypothetical protein